MLIMEYGCNKHTVQFKVDLSFLYLYDFFKIVHDKRDERKEGIELICLMNSTKI